MQQSVDSLTESNRAKYKSLTSQVETEQLNTSFPTRGSNELLLNSSTYTAAESDIPLK